MAISWLRIVVCSALWTHIAGPLCLCDNHCFSISFPTFRIQHLLCPSVFLFPCHSCYLMTSRSPSNRSPPPPQSAPLLSQSCQSPAALPLPLFRSRPIHTYIH